MQKIDRLNKKLAPFRIFKSIECDILVSGDLALQRIEQWLAESLSELGNLKEPDAAFLHGRWFDFSQSMIITK